jgi:hypothetical protein
MKIIQDVLAELFSMFWADARMTTSILIISAIAAAVLNYTSLNPLFAGTLLLLGSLATVVEAAIRHARLKS